MPLYSEHISNMYYSGSPYTGSSYNYGSSVSPLGSSYSASYLNPGGNYSNHSSLGGYSRSGIPSRWMMPSAGRTYSPMLGTISERGTASPVRISSPRRIPISKRSYGTSGYIPRPININTADIDVSRDKYRRKVNNDPIASPKTSPKTEKSTEIKEQGPFMPRVDGKPETGIDSSPGPQRSTIKRGRTVVRLHTIKRRERDSPRKPQKELNRDDKSDKNKTPISAESNETMEEEITENLGWRERLSEDLVYKGKKEKKSLGTKLVEKFKIRDDSDTETNKSSPRLKRNTQSLPSTPQPNITQGSKSPDRRCSMELLAEQASLLDSLIRKENLSTTSLDLSKVGVNNSNNENAEKLKMFSRSLDLSQNALKTTKSDHSLHESLHRSYKDPRQLSKRRSLKKSSSGGSICRLDSITEFPKEPIISSALPSIEESRHSIKKECSQPKPKQKAKITSSVEVSSPKSPLKFKIDNIIVEEKASTPKKELVYSSYLEETASTSKKELVYSTYLEENIPEIISTIESNFHTPQRNSKLRKSIKKKSKLCASLDEDAVSPEPDDGNFWDKIGKRETVYLIKRKQNIDDEREKNKRALFWFPEEAEEDETLSHKTENYNVENTSVLGNDMVKIESEHNENITSLCENTFSGPCNKVENIDFNNMEETKPTCKDKFIKASSGEANINIHDIPSSYKIENITAENEEAINIATQKVENNSDNNISQTINNVITSNINVSSTNCIKTKKDDSVKEINNKEMIKQHLENEIKRASQTCILDKVTPPQDVKKANIEVKIAPSEKHNVDSLKNQSEKICKQCRSATETTAKKSLKTPLTPPNTKSTSKDEPKNNVIKSESTNNTEDKDPNTVIAVKQLRSPTKTLSAKYGDDDNNKGNQIQSKPSINIGNEKTSLPQSNEGTESKNVPDSTIIPDSANVQSDLIHVNTPDCSTITKIIDNKCDDSKSLTKNTPNIENIPKHGKDDVKIVNEPPREDKADNKPNTEEVDDSKLSSPGVVKLPQTPSPRRPIKDEPALRPLIATPRPLQKKVPQVIHSSSSSESSEEDKSDDDDADESDTSEGSAEFFECENNTDGRTSTGSNDSGFDSSAPTSPAGFVQIKKDCDVNCHRKCEKLTANLCGVNQRLLVEALASRNSSKKGGDSPGTSAGTSNDAATEILEQELEQSTAYGLFRKTGRFTPPARTIPRFRKYAIDDFHFIKVLGKGSFGKVLLAELRDTEYYYAVKCLKKDVVLEDDDVECTLIERKVLALGTNHPYLCHLFATFQTDSHLFFVMEYLNGGDLMFHIQQSGRFPEARARFYAAEIVSGLKFLHKRGIVYRDLKLDNILLDFEGHVRIADFGMCKLQIYLEKTADTFCGTPDYMAPEIIKGLKYNQTVDWWSFGVLLYEMLIGQSPFSGCDEDELFWSICNEAPSYPRFLSQDALTILSRLLDKDARTRLGGAECMHGDIRDQEFFRPVHWERLERRELEAPFKPRVRHPLDTQYFDRAFTGERPRLTAVEPQVLRSMDQEPFRGFSYTNPNATDR